MGYTVKGNDITIIRGDSFKCYIKIKTANQLTYTPRDEDIIMFACKNKFSDKEPVLTKEIMHNDMMLHLTPEDTKRLKKNAYVYEISITFIDGDVDTFIQGKFTVTDEIY